ncbi:Protein kinase-like domain superfamily [Arabidopsis thaliana x Arabidopsis arenosa]|uniref:Protein kinase-like domain superfamily n=1 Tax=Arabidopsis thaliana x Arabidopsis arenosa TaxID=1240361 RepID=A0A8T2AX33_9BRAS|nr:Protein kinase-like domain superfamily [Arabidopsis thaliana x Arabidopsis arenosa]
MRIDLSVPKLRAELELNKVLGKGSSGSVSLIKYNGRRDGETLYAAVKTSNIIHADSLYKEFQILSEFKGCSRIVQCYGTKVQERITDDGDVEFKIHMEYASGGSLRNFMSRFKDMKLPDPLIRRFTRMILEGLAVIHGHGYVHCDLKPENILVFPSFELKISDFGLSKREGDSKWWLPSHPFAGTPIYMSPESISTGETRRGLDLWSLGCVVLEMYTGKRPWWDKNYDLEDLKKGHMPLIPKDIPCDAKLFVMSCFAAETDKRKNAFTLLRHCFLRGDVNKIIEPLVMKNENSNDIALELEKIEHRLSQLRCISGG